LWLLVCGCWLLVSDRFPHEWDNLQIHVVGGVELLLAVLRALILRAQQTKQTINAPLQITLHFPAARHKSGVQRG
jgi:hypothetical protein